MGKINEGLHDIDDEPPFAAFQSALDELERELDGGGTITAQYDRLTEWAAREIKIAVPFGNDHVVLEIKARHRVGENESELGNFAHRSVDKLRALLGCGISVSERNGQVVKAKTEVDGLRISVSLARVRSELIELPPDHVPAPPGPKLTYRDEVGDEVEVALLKAGFSHGVLERMSAATKAAAFNEVGGYEVAVPAGDFPDGMGGDYEELRTPKGRTYLRRRAAATAAEMADIPY
jgi:hypothetical protein